MGPLGPHKWVYGGPLGPLGPLGTPFIQGKDFSGKPFFRILYFLKMFVVFFSEKYCIFTRKCQILDFFQVLLIVQEAITRFFLKKTTFSRFQVQQMVNKSRDMTPGTPLERSGAKFWSSFASEPRPDLLWRPIWWQKCVIWGPLGFRAALAHPWPVQARPCPGLRAGGAGRIRGKSGLAGSSIHP